MSYVEKTVEQPLFLTLLSILWRSIAAILIHPFIYPLLQYLGIDRRTEGQKVAFEYSQSGEISVNLSADIKINKYHPGDIQQLVDKTQQVINLFTMSNQGTDKGGGNDAATTAKAKSSSGSSKTKDEKKGPQHDKIATYFSKGSGGRDGGRGKRGGKRVNGSDGGRGGGGRNGGGRGQGRGRGGGRFSGNDERINFGFGKQAAQKSMLKADEEDRGVAQLTKKCEDGDAKVQKMRVNLEKMVKKQQKNTEKLEAAKGKMDVKDVGGASNSGGVGSSPNKKGTQNFLFKEGVGVRHNHQPTALPQSPQKKSPGESNKRVMPQSPPNKYMNKGIAVTAKPVSFMATVLQDSETPQEAVNRNLFGAKSGVINLVDGQKGVLQGEVDQKEDEDGEDASPFFESGGGGQQIQQELEARSAAAKLRDEQRSQEAEERRKAHQESLDRWKEPEEEEVEEGEEERKDKMNESAEDMDVEDVQFNNQKVSAKTMEEVRFFQEAEKVRKDLQGSEVNRHSFNELIFQEDMVKAKRESPDWEEHPGGSFTYCGDDESAPSFLYQAMWASREVRNDLEHFEHKMQMLDTAKDDIQKLAKDGDESAIKQLKLLEEVMDRLTMEHESGGEGGKKAVNPFSVLRPPTDKSGNALPNSRTHERGLSMANAATEAARRDAKKAAGLDMHSQYWHSTKVKDMDWLDYFGVSCMYSGEVHEETKKPNGWGRCTYEHGAVSEGVWIDGIFAYSHDGSQPTGHVTPGLSTGGKTSHSSGSRARFSGVDTHHEFTDSNQVQDERTSFSQGLQTSQMQEQVSQTLPRTVKKGWVQVSFPKEVGPVPAQQVAFLMEMVNYCGKELAGFRIHPINESTDPDFVPVGERFVFPTLSSADDPHFPETSKQSLRYMYIENKNSLRPLTSEPVVAPQPVDKNGRRIHDDETPYYGPPSVTAMMLISSTCEDLEEELAEMQPDLLTQTWTMRFKKIQAKKSHTTIALVGPQPGNDPRGITQGITHGLRRIREDHAASSSGSLSFQDFDKEVPYFEGGFKPMRNGRLPKGTDSSLMLNNLPSFRQGGCVAYQIECADKDRGYIHQLIAIWSDSGGVQRVFGPNADLIFLYSSDTDIWEKEIATIITTQRYRRYQVVSGSKQRWCSFPGIATLDKLVETRWVNGRPADAPKFMNLREILYTVIHPVTGQSVINSIIMRVSGPLSTTATVTYIKGKDGDTFARDIVENIARDPAGWVWGYMQFLGLSLGFRQSMMDSFVQENAILASNARFDPDTFQSTSEFASRQGQFLDDVEERFGISDEEDSEEENAEVEVSVDAAEQLAQTLRDTDDLELPQGDGDAASRRSAFSGSAGNRSHRSTTTAEFAMNHRQRAIEVSEVKEKNADLSTENKKLSADNVAMQAEIERLHKMEAEALRDKARLAELESSRAAGPSQMAAAPTEAPVTPPKQPKGNAPGNYVDGFNPNPSPVDEPSESAPIEKDSGEAV